MPGLLALLAHPDDEFFCGGLLAAARAHAAPVHLAYWTRGEGGGSPRARLIQGFLPRNWQRRAREGRSVARLLQASSVTFLNAIDPRPAPDLRAPEEDGAITCAKIFNLLARYTPAVFVTHGSNGDYGHPAHVALHAAARQAIASEAHPAALITFNANIAATPTSTRFVNASDPADFVLDAAPYREVKRNIVLAHASQKGALESLSGAGPTLDDLLRATRFEGYRCWTQRDAALELLDRWSDSRPEKTPV